VVSGAKAAARKTGEAAKQAGKAATTRARAGRDSGKK
jgi:hypothetical protein